MNYCPCATPPPAAMRLDVTMSQTPREEMPGFSPQHWTIGEAPPQDKVEVGEACYRLRSPLQATYVPSSEGDWEYHVLSLSPRFIGRGIVPREAYDDWRNQMHVAFQCLYGKRPFEMTAAEKEQWATLENAIDVVAYTNISPLVLREVGEVSFGDRQCPQAIHWQHGKVDRVALDDMPAEFASFRPGQPFEAVVERDRRTGTLRKVRYVKRIAAYRKLSSSELRGFLDSLPTTAQAPKATDW